MGNRVVHWDKASARRAAAGLRLHLEPLQPRLLLSALGVPEWSAAPTPDGPPVKAEPTVEHAIRITDVKGVELLRDALNRTVVRPGRHLDSGRRTETQPTRESTGAVN